MKYTLGIDFGGGASKSTLLSADGVVCAENTVEYVTDYPQPGYAEQNPDNWYEAVKENIAAILKKSGIDASDIAAICLDAATHTAVVTDENFNVLRPSIYWTDCRSVEECRFLRENYGELIVNAAYHHVDTIWTIAHLLWLKNHEPQTWAKTEKILFAKDYVRYRLTDVYCTDIIEAQGSMLFDYNTMDWSKELCDLIDFPVEKLPPLKKPTEIIGTITAKAAADTGLCEGTPVLCGATDTVMEVYAAGAVKKGQMTLKLATAGRICVITDKAYPDRDLINYSHLADGLWYPGTATKACASSYRWYRDTFGDSYRDLDAGAKAVPVGCEGLMYHPYLNGELTPYADPLLRGSFTGVRAGHTKAHFSRAVLEGVAFSMLDCITALRQTGVDVPTRAVAIGGGAQSPLWRQITADMLGIELVCVQNSDSSFGSAMVAGVAAGHFESLEAAVTKCSKVLSVTTPNPENTKKYAELFTRYKKIHDALAPIYHEM